MRTWAQLVSLCSVPITFFPFSPVHKQSVRPESVTRITIIEKKDTPLAVVLTTQPATRPVAKAVVAIMKPKVSPQPKKMSAQEQRQLLSLRKQAEKERLSFAERLNDVQPQLDGLSGEITLLIEESSHGKKSKRMAAELKRRIREKKFELRKLCDAINISLKKFSDTTVRVSELTKKLSSMPLSVAAITKKTERKLKRKEVILKMKGPEILALAKKNFVKLLNKTTRVLVSEVEKMGVPRMVRISEKRRA